MVQCFAPCCNHRSGGVGHTCSFFRFPADEAARRWWASAVGRYRKPNTNSRICSCHFPEGKERGPTLFQNKDGTVCKEHKIPKKRPPKFGSSKKMLGIGQHQLMGLMQRVPSNDVPVVGAMVIVERTLEWSISHGEAVLTTYIPPLESDDDASPVITEVCPSVGTQTGTLERFVEVEKILLQAELKDAKEELGILWLKLENFECCYTPSRLSEAVVKMETGLPDRDCFNKIVECATNLENTVSYDAGWKIKRISIEDQVFLTLMKLRHNYKDFHIAALYGCSQVAIRNVTRTWTDILLALLQDDYPAASSSFRAQRDWVSENTPVLHTNPQVGATNTTSNFLSTSDHIYHIPAQKLTHTSSICSCHIPDGEESGPALFMNKDGTICQEYEHSLTVHHCDKETLDTTEPPSVTANVLPVESVRSVESISANDDILVEPMVLMETNSGGDGPPEGSACDGETEVTASSTPAEATEMTRPVVTKVCPSVGTQTDTQVSLAEVEKSLLQTELTEVKEELRALNLKLENFQSLYTPSRLSDKVVAMESGLPDRDCLNKIVECAVSLESSISYRAGWKVACLSIEDQVFLTLMKLRHHYTEDHLAALFCTSSNLVKTVIRAWGDILLALLQEDYPAAPSSSKAHRKPVGLSENTNTLDTNLEVGLTIVSSSLESTSDCPL